jgi:hypothetical protein
MVNKDRGQPLAIRRSMTGHGGIPLVGSTASTLHAPTAVAAAAA